ncbi:MAG TPA: hypothetical protein VK870_15820 [Ignavibacteriaceae bacterium]|nr:hypothetical protein [Ignavibacteriaceae bacterium]
MTINAKINVKIKISNMDGMRIYFDSLISKRITIAMSNAIGNVTTNISSKSMKVDAAARVNINE